MLVAVASRHGATRELAAALARALPRTAAGRLDRLTAVLVPVQRYPDPAGFDAVVLGSAVYDGGWLPPARRYALSVAGALGSRPTWLFSSGLGAEGSDGEPGEVTALRAALGVRDHRTFRGRLEPRLLSAVERRSWASVHDSGGDLRSWSEVDAWAEEIAADLSRQSATARRRRTG